MTVDRCRGDRGQVASVEMLPFGLLVFVVASLVAANAWAVVDAKFATDSAAREAARRYVEATDADRAMSEAVDAGLRALEGHGRRGGVRPIGRVELERCAEATFEATSTVPALTLPFIGGYGSGFEVRSVHTEVVDPYRSGVIGEATC